MLRLIYVDLLQDCFCKLLQWVNTHCSSFDRSTEKISLGPSLTPVTTSDQETDRAYSNKKTTLETFWKLA